MQLALYKGPADGWLHKLGHWIVCTFTSSKYSHVELVIDGVCYSSTMRDTPPGVRSKVIDLTSGRWDLYAIEGDEQQAIGWFKAHAGQAYDFAGVLRFGLPFLPQRADEWFCSESVAAALGVASPEGYTPQSLLDLMKAKA
jgi:hypothetical protein